MLSIVIDESAEPGDVLEPLAELLLDLVELDQRARVIPIRPAIVLRDEDDIDHDDADQGGAKAG
jgi:hypothetical protein